MASLVYFIDQKVQKEVANKKAWAAVEKLLC